MVAVVTGGGLGLNLGSGLVLGAAGFGGSATLGRQGERVYVNAATGNLIVQSRDELLGGRGPDAAGLRTYNSLGSFVDDNGDNWLPGLVRKVWLGSGTANASNSTALRRDEDGSEALFNWDSGLNCYVNYDGAGAYDTLSFDAGSGNWIFTDGTSCTVEGYAGSTGRLLSVTDANGQALSFAYDGAGLLSSVTTAAGEITYYDYSGTQLTQLRTVSKSIEGGSLDRTFTRVRYSYDESNRLKTVTVDLSPEDNSVTDGRVFTTAYTYDGSSKRIASITQSDGAKLSFTYDAGLRIETVTDALNGVTIFAYNTVDRTTTVTDALSQATTYRYDSANRLTHVTSAAVNGVSSTTRYDYNGKGDVIAVVDAENRAVTMAHDAWGNLIRQADDAGNVVRRNYNAQNQLKAETIATAGEPGPLTSSTRYVYDTSGTRLRFTVSPDGRVSEYRYNAQGQRTSAHQYAGATYATSNWPWDNCPSEADMASWVAAQDRTKTQRTDYAYDWRGQLSKSTSYDSVDAAGSGQGATSTQYVYDAAGQLLKTIDARNGVTQLTYDGLGRVLTVTNALNQISVNSYDDVGGVVRTTAFNGLVTTTTFDKLGRTVSVVESANAAPAVSYTAVTLPSLNTNIASWSDGGTYGPLFPSTKTLAGVQFAFQGTPSTNNSVASGDYDIGVNAFGATHVYTLISTSRGTTGANVGSITFIGSAGARHTVSLIEGENVRDHYYGSYTNTLSASYVTPTVWGVEGAGRAHLDMQDFVLPSEFQTQTLTNIVFSSTGGMAGMPVLVAATVATAGSPVATAGSPTYVTAANMTLTGSALTKTSGSNAWDGGANSKQGIAGGASVRFRPAQNNKALMIGLNTDPASDNGYASMDWSIYAAANGRIYAYRDGSQLGDIGSYVAGDLLEVSYNGGAVRFSRNGQLLQSIDALISQPLYADSSFYDVGGQVSDLHFQPYTFTNGAFVTTGGLTIDGTAATKTGGVADSWTSGFRSKVGYTGSASVSFRATSKDKHMLVGLTTNGAAGGDFNSVHWGIYVGTSSLSIYESGRAAPGGWDYQAGDELSVSYDGTAVRYMKNGVVFYSTTTAITQPLYADSSFFHTGGQITDLVFTGSVALGGVKSFYDADSRLRMTQDAGGSRQWFFYDDADRLIGQVNALGQLTKTAYNKAGQATQTIAYANLVNLTSLIDSNGRPTNVTLASIQPTDSADDTKRWSAYDSTGRLAKTVSPLGEVTEFIYDAAGRLFLTRRYANTIATAGLASAPVASAIAPVATGRDQIQRSFYDNDGLLVGTLDATGSLSEHQYDAAGRLVAKVERTQFATASQVSLATNAATALAQVRPGDSGNDRKTLNFFDARGLLVGQLDGEGGFTETVYDAAGNVSQTLSYGLKAVGFNTTSLLSSIRAAAGGLKGKTAYEYDLINRVLKQRVDPEGLDLITTSTYDDGNNQLYVTDPNGITSVSQLDAKGRVTATIHDAIGLNLRTSATYDAQGKLISSMDSGGVTTSTKYDALGRKLEQTANVAGGANLSYLYDAQGNLASLWTNGQPTYYIYDQNGRLRYELDASFAATEFQYDAQGNCIKKTVYANKATGFSSVQVAGGQYKNSFTSITPDAAKDLVTRYVYDTAGHKRFEIDALNAVTEYRFDASGQQIQTLQYDRTSAISGNPTEAQMATLLSPVTTRFDTTAEGFGGSNSVWENGQLKLISQPQSVGWAQVNSARLFNTGASFKLDVTPTQMQQSLHTMVVSNTNNSNRLALIWKNDGTAWAQTFDVPSNSWKEVKIGTYSAGTSYTVEFLTTPFGATVYAYEKGSSRVTGMTYASTGVIDWQQVRLAFATNTASTLPGVTTAYIDNIEEQIPVREFRSVYDAAGRKRFEIDPLGAVTESRYDAVGRVTQTLQHERLISVAGLPTEAQMVALLAPAVARFDSGTEGFTGSNSTWEGGQLKLISQPQSGGWVSVYSPRSQNPGAAFKFDLTPTQLQQSLHTMVVSTTGESSNRLAVIWSNDGNAYAQIFEPAANNWKTTLLGKYTAGTTYTVEFLTNARGASVCVYKKGSDRSAGMTYTSTRDFDWTKVVLGFATNTSASLPGVTTAYVDNLEETAPSARATTYVYDAAGRLTYTQDALGGVVKNRFDKAGNVIERIDYANRVSTGLPATLAAFDAAVRSNAGDHRTRFVYDAAGRVRYTVAQADTTQAVVTETVFDRAGRVARTIQYADSIAYAAVTDTATEASVRTLLPVSTLNARESFFTYDGFGRLEFTAQSHRVVGTDKFFSVTRHSYNAQGRLQKQTAYVNELLTSDLLAGGRLPTTALVAGKVSANAAKDRTRSYNVYDEVGNLKEATDAEGYKESFKYDAFGRKTEYANQLGTTNYVYNAGGQLIEEWSPSVSAYGVDSGLNVNLVGNTTSRILTRFTYDAFGNMASRTEAANVASQQRTTYYAYDALGRQTQTRFAPVGVYDATLDNLSTNGAVDANGVGGAVSRTEANRALTSTTIYDAFGQAVANRDVSGNYSYKTYDLLGRVVLEIDANHNVSKHLYSDLVGQFSALQRIGAAATFTDSFSISASALAAAATTAQTAGSQRSVYSYLDLLGRVSETKDLVEGAFSYDAASGQSGVWNRVSVYTYNAFGDLTAKSVQLDGNGQTRPTRESYLYDLKGALERSVDSEGGVTGYSRNAFGEVSESVEYATRIDPNNPAAAVTSLRARAGVSSAIGFDRVTQITYDRRGQVATSTLLNTVTGKRDITTGALDDRIVHLRTVNEYDAAGNLARTSQEVLDANSGLDIVTYDATADFNTSSNPAGAWSYGYSLQGGAAYAMTLFDDFVGWGWNKSGHTTSGVPAAWKNALTYTQAGVAAGQVALHPGAAADGDYAIMRFTAPADGLYNVSGQFFAGDTGDTNGYIVRNGNFQQPLQFFAHTSDPSVFAIAPLQMASGETLDFVVGKNGAFYSCNTPLTVSIKSTPVILATNGGSTNFYDGLGRLVATRDADNYGTSIFYDALGNVVQTTRHANASAVVAYNYSQQAGMRYLDYYTSPPATHSDDQITTTRYDALGRAIQVRDPLNKGKTTADRYMSYDAAGHVAKQWQAYQDSEGQRNAVSFFSYDKAGQQTSTTTLTQRRRSDKLTYSIEGAVYNAYGEITDKTLQERDANGALGTVYTTQKNWYDAGGRMWKSISGGTAKLYWYDLQDHITAAFTSTADTTGRDLATFGAPQDIASYGLSQGVSRTTTTYDRAGRATGQTGSGSTHSGAVVTTSSSQTLDRWGNALSITRNGSERLRYRYDAGNRVISETQIANAVYNLSDVATVTDVEKRIFYDAWGHNIGNVDALGNANAAQYNKLGQLQYEYHADGGTVTYTYDGLGRLVTKFDELERTYRYTYDQADHETGRSVRTKEEVQAGSNVNGHSLGSSTYDELGRKKSDTTGEDAASWGKTRSYDYDARGLMWRSIDALSNTVLSEYDLGGRKVKETDANGLVTTWGYNQSTGLLNAHADMGGATYTYLYNQLGQLKQQTNTRSQNLVYSYFEDGTLKQLSDNYRGSNTLYDYDIDGNRTRETFTQSGIVFRDVTSVYDKQGRLTHTEDTAPGIMPAGANGKILEIDVGYDAAGNRRRVSTSSLGLGSNGATAWNNTLAWYTYDTMNRWRGQGSLVSGAIQESKYTVFDAAGRAKSNVELTYTTSYEYDFANRIVNEYTASTGAKTTYVKRLDRHIDYLDANQKETRYLYARDRQTVTRIQYTGTNFLANGLTQQVKTQEEGLAASYTYMARVKIENLWEDVPRNATTTAVALQTTGLQVYEYDRAGNVAKLTVDGYSPINADANLGNPDQSKRQRWSSQSTYRTSYYLMDGYRERGQALTGSTWTEGNSINSGATSLTPSESRMGYDANGQLAQITRTLSNSTQQSTWLITDTAGHIVQRREDTQAVTWGYSGTGYYNGNVVTSSQANQDFILKRWAPADTTNPAPQNPPAPVGGIIGGTNALPTQPAQRDAGTWNRQSNFFINDQSVGNYTHTAYPNNIYAFGNIDLGARQSFSSQDNSVQLYTVQDGDTLQAIAQRNWGDSALWYVLADTNGLAQGPDAALSPGSTLKVPSVVRNTNTATSFAVYEPAKTIGNTSPEAVVPPPPAKAGCGAMGMIIMVVVAVVATIVTAGAAAMMMGAAGGTGLAGAFSAGLAVMGGTSTLAGGLAVAAAGIGGAVGSIVSQGVGIAIGAQDKFSWKQVGLSAVGSMVTAGVASAAGTGGIATKAFEVSAKTSLYLNAAINAAAGNAITQGVAVATGLQDKFNWRSVAASAIAAPAAAAASNALGSTINSTFDGSALLQKAADGIVRGVVGQSVRMLVTRQGRMDYASIAADAFGNAIGESLAAPETSRNWFAGARMGANGGTSDQAAGSIDATGSGIGSFTSRLGQRALDQLDDDYDAAVARSGRRALPADSPSSGVVIPDAYLARDGSGHPMPQEPVVITGQSTLGKIGADPGYLANMRNIFTSDISVGAKLSMGWGMTKYAFRGSDTAQGTVQVVGGGMEVVGAVGLTSTGVGTAVAVPLAFHGGDNIGTGLRRIFGSGNGTTLTYQGTYDLTGSRAIAQGVDQGIPFLGGVASLGQGLRLAENRVLSNTSYRALNVADAQALEGGMGLSGKAPNGNWTAVEHVLNAGPRRGGAQMNSPWISTTRDLSVAAEGYNSGNGLVAVNLSRVPAASQVEVWQGLARSNMYGESMAYHRAIWAQEVSVYQSIPAQAIYSPLAPLSQVQLSPIVARSLLTGGVGTFRFGDGN